MSFDILLRLKTLDGVVTRGVTTLTKMVGLKVREEEARP